MALGCDTAATITPAYLQLLKSKGFKFVGRYISGKYGLTAAERDTITDGGLFIVSIFEPGSPTQASYFTAQRGTSDATDAISAARDLGQPEGTPIYFCVDYDASAADIGGPIKRYLQAVKAVFEQQGYPYELGLYGSGSVLTYYKNTYTYTWLAGASGWSGTKDFTGQSIRQYDNNTEISGNGVSLTIDYDESDSAAGGWR